MQQFKSSVQHSVQDENWWCQTDTLYSHLSLHQLFGPIFLWASAHKATWQTQYHREMQHIMQHIKQ